MMEHSRGSDRESYRRGHHDRELRSSDGSFCLVIGDAQMTKMRKSCARAHPLETGGILIGRYNEDHDTALVSRVAESPADSKNGPTTFHRGTRGLQGLLKALWPRREYYLGEWHYHPGRPRGPVSLISGRCRQSLETRMSDVLSRSLSSWEGTAPFQLTYSPGAGVPYSCPW